MKIDNVVAKKSKPYRSRGTSFLALGIIFEVTGRDLSYRKRKRLVEDQQ
jgi:hypothetical protein